MSGNRDALTVFLCGDVMTGRGIDQILPHPNPPRIYESYMKSALGYVEIAEAKNGAIERPVDFSYVWGDALDEFRRRAADVKIINLETAVTASEDYWPGKGINYRMHPANVPCITAADIDCCVLANNHVLDWGYAGLEETLRTLADARVKTAGAGADREKSTEPAVIEVPGKGRVIVWAFGSATSGIPDAWAAGEDEPGVNLLPDLSDRSARRIAKRIGAFKREGDIVVASIHWGGNWGYRVPAEQRDFAHALIDAGGVDVIHGHSSHHPKGIEVYHGRPVFYGCGDFLNDYEGIDGYEGFRDDLTLMYFLALDPATGALVSLDMVPMQVRRFRLNRASARDAWWLSDTLDRESRGFGATVEMASADRLVLRWT